MKENTSENRFLPARVMPDMIAPLIAPITAPEDDLGVACTVNPGKPIAPIWDYHATNDEAERQRIRQVSQAVTDYELYELLRFTAKELRRRDFDLCQGLEHLDLIGNTLASNYGELGRELYLDFTANSPDCTPEAMNKLYDHLLHYCTPADLQQLVDLVRRGGVELDRIRGVKLPRPFAQHLIATRGVIDPNPTTSFFGHSKIETYMLPWMIQDIIDLGETPTEKDLLLLGSLTVISSMLPNVVGIYGRKRLHPNLYLFVSGPAASGKGAVEPTLDLARPLHEMQAAQCQQAILEWKHLKVAKVEELGPCPPFAAHIIPANTTSTAFYRMLYDLDGRGLLFETEADTLSAMLNNKDFGNYTDGLRKAFHHETIQYHRKTDNEHVEITDPQLSVCLTGTPNQINKLIDNVENGLYSRFMFYHLEQELRWKDQFAGNDEEPLSDIFRHYGETLLGYYKQLMALREPLQFRLTQAQVKEFNEFFDTYQGYIARQLGMESVANVRRMAISAFRIAMVLGTLRHFERGEQGSEIVCRDCDFYFAMHVSEVLICHLGKTLEHMGSPKPMPMLHTCPTEAQHEELLLNLLDGTFSRTDFAEKSSRAGFDPSRCRRLLEKLLRERKIVRCDHGLYKRVA